MIKFFFNTILLCGTSLLVAQQDIVYLNQVTPQEGLSETTNWFLHPDREGFIWIGSLDGLNVYDGKEMNVYKTGEGPLSIKGAAVQSPFFETTDGDIWFTTDEAINGFQKKQATITSRTLSSVDGPQLYNAFHLENDKYLWIAVGKKLYRYDITAKDPASEQAILSSFGGMRGTVIDDSTRQVSTLLSAFWQPDLGMEIIQFAKGGTLLKRDTLFSILKPDTLPVFTIFRVVAGSNNIAWASTTEGLLRIDINAPYSNYKHFFPPVPTAEIVSIANISQEVLGVLLNNGELHFFDKKRERFSAKAIRFHDLVTKAKIQKFDNFFLGKDSTIWLSADGQGVFYGKLSKMNFQSLLDINELKREAIRCLYEDSDHRIQVFSRSNRICFTKNAILSEYVLQSPYNKAVVDNHGQTWGIKNDFIFYTTEENKQEYLSQKLDVTAGIYDIVNYNASYLLLATVRGIFFYNKQDHKLTPTSYKQRTVRLFLNENNQLWSANSSGTLQVWQLSEAAIPTLDSVTIFEKPGMINDITSDPDRKVVWVGTIKGLLRIDQNTFADSLITEKDGLYNQNIQAIVVDTTGVLWLSTNQGVTRYQPERSGPAAFRQYTFRDGLSSNEYQPGAALLASNGSIWLGSTKGVDVFNPYELSNIGHAPKLILKNLKIHDQPWSQSATSCALKSLELTYQQNTLAFELAALEYTDPSRNQFMVQLEHEGNADTTFLGTQNRITYANLSPGEYVFRFTACNAEGIWQPEWYELPILIEPPYYQTWWFRLLVIFALMALVGLILTLYYRYQLREKQLELERQERQAERERLQLETRLNLEQERTRIASDFHDEIGGGLSTIRNASAVASRKEDVEDIRSVLQRVSEISLSLIGNMRTIIWAMDPGFDSLDDLSAYIRSYTRQFLDDNGLESQIDIPLEMPQVDLNGKARHNLLLVIKEALHNVVKHAGATRVDFKMDIRDELTITIADNGQGFDPAKLKRRGSGLKNMKKRINSIGGEITWTPHQPQGTIVTIHYPITTDT